MNDKWELVFISTNEDILATFEATRESPPDAFDYSDVIRIKPGQTYKETGFADCINVYKNDKLYAVCHCTVHKVVAGVPETGSVIVTKSELVAPKVDPVCTCGGWACYGRDVFLHSFECDLVRNA